MKESTGAAETGKKNIDGSMTLVTDKKIKAGRWRTLCPPHHTERESYRYGQINLVPVVHPSCVSCLHFITTTEDFSNRE